MEFLSGWKRKRKMGQKKKLDKNECITPKLIQITTYHDSGNKKIDFFSTISSEETKKRSKNKMNKFVINLNYHLSKTYLKHTLESAQLKLQDHFFLTPK